MFLRSRALKKVGLFDERFFLYFEDTDLSRRIWRNFRNVYYPSVCIYHIHRRASYRDPNILRVHLRSAVQYFNKWGWFIDPERWRINREVIKKLKRQALGGGD